MRARAKSCWCPAAAFGPMKSAQRRSAKASTIASRIEGRSARWSNTEKCSQECGANLVPVSGIAEIHEALRNGRIALWMPYEMVVADPTIPESWDVTSDSLAAWLAKQMNASALLLVKSVKIDGPQPGIEDLMRRGWVDPAFATFTSGMHLRFVLLGQGEQMVAERMLTAAATVVATSHG